MDAIRTGILHVPDVDSQAGKAVVEVLRSTGVRTVVVVETSAQSQRNWIADILYGWCDDEELDLVLTIGGTLPAPGPSGQEIVPKATEDVIERLLPGLAEAMRAYAQEESELALLECGLTGVRGRTLIVNLPQGPDPASLFLEAIAGLIEPAIAHLREQHDAPTLAGRLFGNEPQERPGPEQKMDGPKSGLSESEFAEYLRRSSET